MRRATAILLGTATGTALLVGVKYGRVPGVNAGDTIPEPSGSAESASPSGTDLSPSASGSSSVSGPVSTSASGRQSSTRASCRSYTGSPAVVASPGVGSMVVTISVCGKTVNTSTGSLNQSNWDKNPQAISALNSLAVQHYGSDISRVHYSGATLTSNAYQTSLRSALNKAGV